MQRKAVSWAVLVGVAAIATVAIWDAFATRPEPAAEATAPPGTTTGGTRTQQVALVSRRDERMEWTRRVVERGGYEVTGESSAALSAQGHGGSFYIWATSARAPRDQRPPVAWKRLGSVEGTTVQGEGRTWAWWTSGEAGLVVWLNAGPASDARLPSLEALGPLVRASRTIGPSWRAPRIPRCRRDELEFGAEAHSEDALLELTNVSDYACRTRRLPLEVRFFDRGGEEVEASANVAQAFGKTTLSPGVDLVVGFAVLDRCGGGKPWTFVATAGPYTVDSRTPRPYGCLDDLGP